MALVYKCDRCGVVNDNSYTDPRTDEHGSSYFKLHKYRSFYDVGHVELCESCSKDLDILVDNFFREKEPVDIPETKGVEEKPKWSGIFKNINIRRG